MIGGIELRKHTSQHDSFDDPAARQQSANRGSVQHFKERLLAAPLQKVCTAVVAGTANDTSLVAEAHPQSNRSVPYSLRYIHFLSIKTRPSDFLDLKLLSPTLRSLPSASFWVPSTRMATSSSKPTIFVIPS